MKSLDDAVEKFGADRVEARRLLWLSREILLFSIIVITIAVITISDDNGHYGDNHNNS